VQVSGFVEVVDQPGVVCGCVPLQRVKNRIDERRERVVIAVVSKLNTVGVGVAVGGDIGIDGDGLALCIGFGLVDVQGGCLVDWAVRLENVELL